MRIVDAEQAHAFREGFAAVLLNGKWGFVNRAGALVIPATLEEPGPFSEGLAVAGPPGKLYYIDTHGKTVLPGPYREATPFVHGLAAVRRGAREVEYIQKSGRAVFRYTTGGK